MSCIQSFFKHIARIVDDKVNEIFKIPNELYKGEGIHYFTIIDQEYIQGLFQSRQVTSHIIKEFGKIRLTSIFKEEIKKKSFKFEQFMMLPDFYRFFNILVDRMFNILSSLHKFGIKFDRTELLSQLGFSKSKAEFEKKCLFTNILQFIHSSLSLVHIDIPIDLDLDLLQQPKVYREKNSGVFDMCKTVMEELFELFRSSGLSQYLKRDIDVVKRYRSTIDYDFTEDEYLITEVIEENEQAQMVKKPVHVKLSSVKSYLQEDDQHNIFLNNKRRLPLSPEVKEEQRIHKTEKKVAPILSLSYDKLVAPLKKTTFNRLTFTPVTIRFES